MAIYLHQCKSQDKFWKDILSLGRTVAMKRIFYIGVLVLFMLTLHGSAQGQGLNLTRPDAVGGHFVASHLDGAGGTSGLGPGLELFLKYNLTPRTFLHAGTGVYSIMDGNFTPDTFTETLLPTFEVQAGYGLTEGTSFTPFIYGGLHAFGFTVTPRNGTASDRFYDGGLLLGGGFEYALNEFWSFRASGDYRYIFTADADPKPKFWMAKAGLAYALKPPEQPEREEIEYPLGDDEISLDDLFREDTESTDRTYERDALDALFSGEQATGTLEAEEASSSYPDTEAGQLMARIQDLRNEMEQRTRRIENLENKVLENERAIASVTGGIAGAQGSFGIDNSRSFKENYENALQRFYNKQYQDAIRMFSGLMASNPDHRLASNCQYWIGESYNQLKQYRQAIDAFRAVLNYKSSYKFDDALLMSGICYLKLGDSATARENFQQLVSRYPDSEYAPKAMRYLGRL